MGSECYGFAEVQRWSGGVAVREGDNSSYLSVDMVCGSGTIREVSNAFL